MNSKKIVVISDTHGDNRWIDYAVEKETPFDYLIHCGDSETSLAKYQNPANPYRFAAVRGNCDFSSSLPTLTMERVLYYNILVTHGHLNNVRYGLQALAETGYVNHADIILYGHTHAPEICEVNGILIINPGSPAYPRGETHEPTYAVLTVDEDYNKEAVIRVISE